MKIELYIANKLRKSKEKKSLSFVFFRIAVIATTLGVIVMIWTVGILDGFKNAVTDKLVGLTAHVIVSKHVTDNSYSLSPINKENDIIEKLQSVEGVRNVQTFAIKPGLIRTKTDTYGVVLKGIDDHFDWNYFNQFLIKGRKLIVSQGGNTGKEIVLSEKLAQKMRADTGDFVYMYFLDDELRTRKYQIVGIYNTNYEELDMLYVLADIHDVQRLNNWNYVQNEQITGYEIFLDDINKLQTKSEEIYKLVGIRFDIMGEKLKVETIRDLYPAIFDWLGLLNLNSLVLLIIMTVIVSLNMITSLLILILDKTQNIAIFKVVGANNWSIRQIFIYNGIYILFKGLLWGNAIGIIVAVIQKSTHFIPLDPQIYYINYVPIDINFLKIVLINLFLVILTFIVLIIPSMIISKISPAKVLKFD